MEDDVEHTGSSNDSEFWEALAKNAPPLGAAPRRDQASSEKAMEVSATNDRTGRMQAFRTRLHLFLRCYEFVCNPCIYMYVCMYIYIT